MSLPLQRSESLAIRGRNDRESAMRRPVVEGKWTRCSGTSSRSRARIGLLRPSQAPELGIPIRLEHVSDEPVIRIDLEEEKKRMLRLLLVDVTLTKGDVLHAHLRFTGLARANPTTGQQSARSTWIRRRANAERWNRARPAAASRDIPTPVWSRIGDAPRQHTPSHSASHRQTPCPHPVGGEREKADAR